MGTKKILFMGAFLLFLAVIVSACAGPPPPVPLAPLVLPAPLVPPDLLVLMGESSAATDLTCTQCHNGTDLLSSKTEEWETSQHGVGELFIGEGYNPSCAGCHSRRWFQRHDRRRHLTPDKVTNGDPHPSKQDCLCLSCDPYNLYQR